MIRRILIGTAAVVAGLGCAGLASATTLMLTVSSGTLTNTYTDSGSGLIQVPNPTTINEWYLVGAMADSQPAVGDATDDYVVLNLGSVENLGSSAPLVVTATETSFTPFATASGTFDMTLSDYAETSSTLTGLINSTTINSLNIPAPAGTAVQSSQPVSSGLTSAFTMTETLVLPTSPAASGSVFGELYLFYSPVPEPATISLVAMGLLVGALTIRRRKV